MTYDAEQAMDSDDTPVGDTVDPTVALVQRAVAGDDRAFGELYDAWFDRVYDRAYGVVRDHALAAEVAQDCFLRAWQQLATVRDPSVFGGWLLRIARNTALNRLRTERRTTAVDDAGLAVIERAGPSPATAPAGFRVEDRLYRADDPAVAAEDDEIVTLVADSIAALEGRDAEVLDLGLRLGLTPAEIGEAVGLNRNAANQAVHRARRRFRTAVEARVLWRRGRPDCPDLAAVLADAGITRFGADAVAMIDAHASGCERCSEARRLRLDPAVLFGAVPLVGAPSLLKTEIANALAGEGVPMSGSVHASGSASTGPGPDGGPDGDLPTGPTEVTVPTTATTAAMAGPVESRRGGRGRALVAAAIVVLLAVVASVVVFAESTGETEPRSGAAPATRPADLATPSTVGVPTTVPLAPETAPPDAAPPATPPRVVTPPVTDPPPPPSPTGTISVSPASKLGTWSMTAPDSPRLTWSSERASSVTVDGPGFSSGAPGGSVVVCPPSGATGGGGQVCTSPPPGAYRYRLTLRDEAGTVVFTQDAVLTVGA